MDSREISWQVAEQLGDDLFAFSTAGETKHQILTAVVETITGGLVLAFLMGVLDVQLAGERIRGIIKQALQSARENVAKAGKSTTDVANRRLMELKDIKDSEVTERLGAARDGLEGALREEGLSDSAAKRIARVVFEVVTLAVKR